METATAADPGHARRLARSGRVLAAVGDFVAMVTFFPLLLLIVAHGVVWILAKTGAWTAPAGWDLGRILSDVASVGIAALLVGIGLSIVGRDLRHDGEQLAGLEIRIGPDGIEWSGYRPGSVTWADLEHVVVTANRPGRRRLRLAAPRHPTQLPPPGQRPAPPPVRISTFWEFWQRVLHRDVYLLDAPVDRLSIPARRLVAAIEAHSGGRFPDLYDRGQFRQPDQPSQERRSAQ